MEKTDLFLGYRYIKASVEISVSSESETLLSIDVCRMLQMSSGQRPWQLHVIPFDLVNVSEKKGVISVSLMNETIEASCNFTLNKKALLKQKSAGKTTPRKACQIPYWPLCFPYRNHSSSPQLFLLNCTAMEQFLQITSMCLKSIGYLFPQ